jgi:predicted nucleic acid-binding protein
VIAVDSSVLIDVLTADEQFGDSSSFVLSQGLANGDVVVCEAVVAEIQLMLDSTGNMMETLNAMGIRFLAINEQAAVRAGVMNRRFRDRGGRRERVAADFLIGAHALLQCNSLITRDAGFFRDYYKGLKVIVPKA